MPSRFNQALKKSYPCDAKTCPYLKMSIQFVDCDGCDLARSTPLREEVNHDAQKTCGDVHCEGVCGGA